MAVGSKIDLGSDRTEKSNMDAEELKRRYAAGQRDFTGVNLIRAKLIGADLVGVNLWGANLSGANLVRAKLWGANLTGANLVGANLTKANLCGMKLSLSNHSRQMKIRKLGLVRKLEQH